MQILAGVTKQVVLEEHDLSVHFILASKAPRLEIPVLA